MRKLIRASNAIVLSVAKNLTRQAGIGHRIAGSGMSIPEGSRGLLSRHFPVDDDDAARARQIRIEAGTVANLLDQARGTPVEAGLRDT